MREIPVRPAEAMGRTGLMPTDALDRFEPPDSFSATSVDAVTKIVRYGFRTADLALLIHAGVGSEVVPMMPLAALPHGPAWLLGIINLRGNLIPVCDLRLVLNLETEAAAKQMILVMDKGDRAVGFVIDGYPCTLNELKPARQVPKLPEPLVRYVKAALSDGNDIWFEFDHEGFLEDSNR